MLAYSYVIHYSVGGQEKLYNNYEKSYVTIYNDHLFNVYILIPQVFVQNYGSDFVANIINCDFSLQNLPKLSRKENVRFCIFADIDSNEGEFIFTKILCVREISHFRDNTKWHSPCLYNLIELFSCAPLIYLQDKI